MLADQIIVIKFLWSRNGGKIIYHIFRYQQLKSLKFKWPNLRSHKQESYNSVVVEKHWDSIVVRFTLKVLFLANGAFMIILSVVSQISRKLLIIYIENPFSKRWHILVKLIVVRFTLKVLFLSVISPFWFLCSIIAYFHDLPCFLWSCSAYSVLKVHLINTLWGAHHCIFPGKSLYNFSSCFLCEAPSVYPWDFRWALHNFLRRFLRLLDSLESPSSTHATDPSSFH